MPVRKSDSEHQHEGPTGRLPLGWMRMYAVMFEFLAYMGALGYAGWWLDQRRGWEPWGLLVGLLLGTTLGVLRIIRESKHIGQ